MNAVAVAVVALVFASQGFKLFVLFIEETAFLEV